MTLQEVITKAIEGGWKPKEDNWNRDKSTIRWTIEKAVLDPLFWQSLGKAMEWDRDLEGLKCSCSEDIYYSYQFCPKCGKQMRKVEVMTTYWKKEWHRFIDHLAEGKDAESFFESLNL